MKSQLAKIKKQQKSQDDNTFMSSKNLQRFFELCTKLEYPRLIAPDGKEYYVMPVKKQAKRK